jgi:endoglucanase Acf2
MVERQYFYFYGSTSDVGSNGTGTSASTPRERAPPASTQATESTPLTPFFRPSPSSPATTAENDSLAGECLVQTDNEDYDSSFNPTTPQSSAGDFQQLLVVSHPGTNGRLNTLESLPEHDALQGNCLSMQCIAQRYRRFRRNHSVSHLILMIAGITLCISLVALVLLSPQLSKSNDGSTPWFRSKSSSSDGNGVLTETGHVDSAAEVIAEERAADFKMPWPQVDRSTYNDPMTNFMNPSLFHSSFFVKKQSSANSTDKSQFIFPYPTGSFWTNLVLPETADQNLSYPIAVYPYAYKWADQILVVSYPAQHRAEDAKSIHDYFFPDLSLGLLPGVQPPITARKIVAFDPLSVTLRFYTSIKSNYWETYLVQGSPYVTMKLSNVIPYVKAFTKFTDVLCPKEDVASDVAMNSLTVSNGLFRRKRRRRAANFGVCSSEISSINSTNPSPLENEELPPLINTLHGVQFIIETQEGVRWIMFASEYAVLKIDMHNRTMISISAENDKEYSGVIRFAIIPSLDSARTSNDVMESGTSEMDQVMNSTGVRRLIYHAGVYPVSGTVSWKFRAALASGDSERRSWWSSLLRTILGTPDPTDPKRSTRRSLTGKRIGTIDFKFNTESFASATEQQDLLMLSLLHHVEGLLLSSLSSSASSQQLLGQESFDLVYNCIKGPMRPATGSLWSMDIPLLSIGFDGDSGSNNQKLFLSPAVRPHLLKSLQEDVQLSLPTTTEDIYGFGKQSARMAQLAHISHLYMMNVNSTDMPLDDDSIAAAQIVFETAHSTLRTALASLLSSKVSDRLVYDSSFGGMVTINGLMDSHADFGNGRYNDHHFHYGYLLYACAIMGKIDPTFVDEFGNHVDSIFYDIANNVNFRSKESIGPFFPGSRHKVWFDGHSYASGMFPFGNGKSQESSSEAVNGYYGAYLWSIVRNGSAEKPSLDESTQTDFARLLLATEVRGAKLYWHMMPPAASNSPKNSATIYSPQFSSNLMVGNIGMLDALCSTWFGNEELYVHMINFMPVTSVTGELFSQSYIEHEYKKSLEPLGEVEMAWRGYVVADHAIVSPNAAWREAEKVVSSRLDSALSKSQLLFWIATRAGFDASAITSTSESPSINKKEPGSNQKAACSAVTSCSTLGLIGDCCPASNGVFLECCKF